MKWFHSNANLIKLILAALLGLFTIFGFVEYFIADKAIAAYGTDGTIMNGKVIAYSFTGKDTITSVITGPTKIDTHTIVSYGPEIKVGLSKAVLVFASISLITIFVVLGMAQYKKPVVALVSTIIGAVILLTLFILLVLLMSNLANVNDGLNTTIQKVQYGWGQAHDAKPKDPATWVFTKLIK